MCLYTHYRHVGVSQVGQHWRQTCTAKGENEGLKQVKLTVDLAH